MIMLLRRIKSSVLVAALSMGTAMSMSVPASAQFGAQAGFADSFRPEFLDRDMPLFVEILKLEDWQRPIIEVLLQDYMVSYEAGVEDVKNRMRGLQSRIGNARPDAVMEMILEPLAVWDAERAELGRGFLNNVRAQLTGAQIDRWPRFERTLRREKELPKGELMGESTDLFTLVRTLRFPYEIEEAIDPIVVEYELALDEALAIRAAKIESLQDRIKDAMASMDFEAGLSATDQIMATRVQVRRVQDEFVVRIAEALPGEFSGRFRNAALAEGYPRAFRPTPIPRLLESVRTLSDLTDGQKAQLDEIEIDFDLRLDNIEMRIVESFRINEPGEARIKVQRMIDRRNGKKVERIQTEADRIVATKNDLVDETRRRILAVLTPEQTGALPGNSRPSDGVGGPTGGNAGGVREEKIRTLAPGKDHPARPRFKSPDELSKNRDRGLGARSTSPAGDKGGKKDRGSD
ncbi:MAG: hypothetical protein CMJ27_08755 [Phycisphaerae bacterium]|nr:hypothetical protein [Phycisphaerae bacterium]